MENVVNIYDLLPEKINDTIKKLMDALAIVQTRKNTISKFIRKEKNKVACPQCHDDKIIKNGHDKNGVQIYKCKCCGKSFTPCTNTFISHTKLTYEKLVIFFECMNDRLSIRKTAEKMEVNKNTVFLLRHKVLDCISEIRKASKLKGSVQADETYKAINLKGTKKENMPRFSKPRSSNGGSKRGISNHKVCIASAIDEYDNCFLEIAGTGPITSDQVKKVFQSKIDGISCLITDCKSSYESFAKENNIKLEQVKSGLYVNESGYNLSNINSLHSELSTFPSCFKGVSTKHLQHYLDWFNFQKLINYTTKVLKQPITMMKKATTYECSIRTKNVYFNSSGIDFNKVYAEYNYSSLTI